jgi:hypothetical protein
MALTQQQRIALAGAYAPILYFHADEAFVPLRPEHYLNAAALWEGKTEGYPATDMKKDWGLGGPGFPRRATVPHFGISINPAEDVQGAADPDGDGVNEWYLGHVHTDGTLLFLESSSDREVWLDSSGWADGTMVTATSANDRCNRAAAIDKWREQGLARVHSDWYYAEVQELSDLERILASFEGFAGKAVDQILREILGEVWIVWYYFLYPIHEEYLRRCEQVADSDAHRGDYEGDWNAVGVVVRQPAVLPWDPGGSFPQPTHVAYGVRLRGLAEDFMPSLFKQGMIVRDWPSETPHIPGTTHPRVFVTKGYHNNYPAAGDHNPVEAELAVIPIGKLTCDVTEEFDEKVNEFKETLEDIGETAKDIAVTVAKVAAGSAIGAGIGGFIGAGIGALAGAVAGLVEALSTSNTDDVPSEEIREGMEREQGPPPGRYGLVLKPPGVNALLPAPPGQPPETAETATQVRDWLGSDQDRLVDRHRQIWWRYEGRWGVRCQNDPNERRSGMAFPDFKRVLLNDLAVHLAKTSQ